jgi:hypothetical protein
VLLFVIAEGADDEAATYGESMVSWHHWQGGIIPDDAMVVRLLTGLGCQEIERLGHGTAQARVPVAWVNAVERNGFYTGSVKIGARAWTIDMDIA